MKPASLASALIPAVFAFLSCSVQAADPAPLKKTDGVLVDAKGMTVYTFDKDAAGKSACSGRCAENWPPVIASDAKPAEPYSVVMREDGSKQLAYHGKPLYTFVKDKKPGDKTGDKAMDAWHVVSD